MEMMEMMDHHISPSKFWRPKFISRARDGTSEFGWRGLRRPYYEHHFRCLGTADFEVPNVDYLQGPQIYTVMETLFVEIPRKTELDRIRIFWFNEMMFTVVIHVFLSGIADCCKLSCFPHQRQNLYGKFQVEKQTASAAPPATVWGWIPSAMEGPFQCAGTV